MVRTAEWEWQRKTNPPNPFPNFTRPEEANPTERQSVRPLEPFHLGGDWLSPYMVPVGAVGPPGRYFLVCSLSILLTSLDVYAVLLQSVFL